MFANKDFRGSGARKRKCREVTRSVRVSITGEGIKTVSITLMNYDESPNENPIYLRINMTEMEAKNLAKDLLATADWKGLL